MEILSGRNNPQIKEAQKLLDKKERKITGRYILEGARLCKDAAENGTEIEKLFITEGAAEKYGSEYDIISRAAERVYFISEDNAVKLSDTKNSQNIFCICIKKENHLEIKKDGMYLLLDNIQNPDNLGAAVRTAEALGADGLILNSGCDIYSPKALRASMGALIRFPVMICDEAVSFIAKCVSDGMRVFATVPDSSADDITKTDKSGGAVLVIGNEGNGVSDEVLKACTDRITIPMKGKAESLNAAAATAISVWEFMKDR